ncbi:MAG: ATP-binding protein [Bacilli bacterium]|nr:ATP-binding protein [Bacilli bacterium]
MLNGLLRVSNIDCYVTGSNSKFLSSDIITEFRGRGDEIRIHPLSFKEFYSAFQGEKSKAYDEYSLYGGMPELINRKTHEEKSTYLNNLINNVYLRDIVDRNNLKNDTKVLGELLDILSSSIGSLTNPPKLEKTYNSQEHININRITISKYLDAFVNSFLISKVQRYDIKGKAYIDSPFKYYFEDIGLRNARINFRQNEPTHTKENIIYNELILRGYSVDIGIIKVNYKDENNKSYRKQYEVDFVCYKGNSKYYIQSAYAINDKEKVNQETRGLLKINDSFKKIVILKDCYVPWYDENGIYYIGLEQFLLDPNLLEK